MLRDSNIPVSPMREISSDEREYTIQCSDGSGTMHCIDVYPGIRVIYNRFHTFHTPAGDTPHTRHIEINHCLRGKYEGMYNGRYYVYLEEGDLSVSKWTLHRDGDSFPLGYYEGMEMLIDVEKALGNELFGRFHIDIAALERKLDENANLHVFRSTPQIRHICLEMYEVDEKMKMDYLRIKVLELLLFLARNDFEILRNEKRYYPKKQVETVRRVRDYLADHLSEKAEVDALAGRFGINVNTFRKAFKEIYGKPVYQWYKEYRLEHAKRLLVQTELPVIDIANRVGYSNPSKFSAAFSRYAGMTPQQYRKSNIRMD